MSGVVLPKRLDGGSAERLLRDLGADPQPLALNLDRLHRLEFMAEPRPLGLMVRARRAGHRVELATRYPIDMEAGTVRRLVDLFADTIGGVVLAQMSTSIVDGNASERRPAIIRAQGNRAIEKDGFFGFGAERAAPMVDVFGGPAPPAMVADTVGREFELLFRAWVSGMALPSLDAGVQETKLTSLIDFAYETFDNTRRHAVRDLDRRPIEGVRFVLLRSVMLDEQLAAASADRVGNGPLASYLRRLGELLPETSRILELTVADCGVGIAPTLTGDAGIHDGDWEREVDTVESAFRKHRRAASRRTGGQGLWKALRAVSELDGFVAVRTGRTELTRDFLSASNIDAAWTRSHLPFMPGSALSLLFPWSSPSGPPAIT